MRKTKLMAVTFLLGLIIALAGCSTNIGVINSDTPKYENEVVSISGEITDSYWFDFLSQGVYQVTDESGSIWIVTDVEPPQEGTSVTVKGSVQSAFSIGNTYFGTVIIESQ